MVAHCVHIGGGMSATPSHATGSLLTLGVEEEFHLVDLRTRQLTPRAQEVLAELAGSKHTYTSELQQTVVETNSEVCDTLAALRGNLTACRAELVAVAG